MITRKGYDKMEGTLNLIKTEFLKRTIIPILFVLLFVPAIMYNLPQKTNFDATVYDDAEVLSQTTEAYITQLNNRYVKYKNTPQLVIVTVESPMAPLDLYAHQVFGEIGLNESKGDCGILVIITTSKKEYYVKCGEGFNKNPMLKEDLSKDFITEEMYALLDAEMYDDFVIESANYIDTILRDNESGKYDEALSKRNTTIIIIFIVVLMLGTTYIVKYCADKKKEKQRKEQEKEDTLSSIKQLLKLYEDHMLLFGAERDIVEDMLTERFKDKIPAEIKTSFLSEIYSSYESYCIRLFSYAGKEEYRALYKQKWQQLNPIEFYKELNLTSVKDIVEMVNKEQEEKLQLNDNNKNNITTIFGEVVHTLPQDITYEVLNMVHQHTVLNEKLLSREEILDDIYIAVEAINMWHPATVQMNESSRTGTIKHHAIYMKEKAYVDLITAPNRPPFNLPWEAKKEWIDRTLQQHIQKEITLAIAKEREHQQKMQQYETWRQMEEY